MARIHVLNEQVANQIAAGEVVQRPASVVKELVENAIDANASRIEVALEAGGKKLIRVRDNGHGMSPEDAELALQRFATSKISQSEDLNSIQTMGFRGEALPSIAAVSHFKLTTRELEAAEGVQITTPGGDEPQVKTVGCPAGTTVEVADLFYNTPAREKFLATTGRERAVCVEWVTRLALARPDIAFKLEHDGAVLLTTSGSGDLRSVLASAYGSTVARGFVEVEAEQSEIRVYGLTSRPTQVRSRRSHQMFFVNRRFVQSRQISHAVGEAYGLLLPSGKHPLCALHLAIEPGLVDPNVHPTKIEVKFRTGGSVHQVVQHAVEKALSDAGLRSLSQRPRYIQREDDRTVEQVEGGLGRYSGSGPALRAGRIAPAGEAERRRARRLRVNPFEDQMGERDDGLAAFEGTAVAIPQREDEAQERLLSTEAGQQMEVLGQLADRYIMVHAGGEVLFVDQHRAAERVLLEQLHPEAISKQFLVAPQTLELAATEVSSAREHKETLSELGYDLEEFGTDTILVRSVPAALVDYSPMEALQEAISDLAEWDAPSGIERATEKLRVSVACHAATKAGRKLNLPEMHKLVEDLLKTETPAVCPHGDPIIVSLSIDKLDSEFQR